jgi:Isopropylmalate/homocitrate/citramalate synthases|nr:hypothetical protein [uncultured Azohydromonas sp.]
MSNQVWNGAGRRIFMQEVGTRDGLQVEPAFVPTEDKIALVRKWDALLGPAQRRPSSSRSVLSSAGSLPSATKRCGLSAA